MEKKLTFIILSTALLIPAVAGAQPAFAPAVSNAAAAGGAICTTCPAGGFSRSVPARKKMTMYDMASMMETPDEFKKKKKVIKRREGGDTETSYSVKVPAGDWRILWRLQATDEKEAAVLVLQVDTAVKSDYHQGMTKEIKGLGTETFGVMNICDVASRKFKIKLSAKKAKWTIEIQSLYD